MRDCTPNQTRGNRHDISAPQSTCPPRRFDAGVRAEGGKSLDSSALREPPWTRGGIISSLPTRRPPQTAACSRLWTTALFVPKTRIRVGGRTS